MMSEELMHPGLSVARPHQGWSPCARRPPVPEPAYQSSGTNPISFGWLRRGHDRPKVGCAFARDPRTVSHLLSLESNRYCTITWPSIHGCGVHVYTNVPAASNVIEAVEPGVTSPVSKAPFVS